MEEALLKLSVAAACCVLAAACCRSRQAWSSDAAGSRRPERISVSSAPSEVVSVQSDSTTGDAQPGAQDVARPVELQADDDSDNAPVCLGRDVRQRLLTDSMEFAASLRYTSRGISVHVRGIESYMARSLPISDVVALHLAGSLPTDAKVLRSGRLCRSNDSGSRGFFNLSLHEDGANGRLLVCNSVVFFNFAAEQWQPLSRRRVYMPSKQILYCAFVPTDDLLFIKIGYKSMTDKRRESILPYLEKKTERLRLTNVPGAGVFMMPLPKSHEAFEDSARAAEESLKSAVCCSRLLQVSPSASNMEFVTFSTSLEYFLIKSREGSALHGLTQTLRDFSGDADLSPLRAVAEPPCRHHGRLGKRRLVPWSEQLLPPRANGALARASTLRSRQHITKMASPPGPFARRLSRRWRSLSAPTAKRRKAKSCP